MENREQDANSSSNQSSNPQNLDYDSDSGKTEIFVDAKDDIDSVCSIGSSSEVLKYIENTAIETESCSLAILQKPDADKFCVSQEINSSQSEVEEFYSTEVTENTEINLCIPTGDKEENAISSFNFRDGLELKQVNATTNTASSGGFEVLEKPQINPSLSSNSPQVDFTDSTMNSDLLKENSAEIFDLQNNAASMECPETFQVKHTLSSDKSKEKITADTVLPQNEPTAICDLQAFHTISSENLQENRTSTILPQNESTTIYDLPQVNHAVSSEFPQETQPQNEPTTICDLPQVNQTVSSEFSQENLTSATLLQEHRAASYEHQANRTLGSDLPLVNPTDMANPELPHKNTEIIGFQDDLGDLKRERSAIALDRTTSLLNVHNYDSNSEQVCLLNQEPINEEKSKDDIEEASLNILEMSTESDISTSLIAEENKFKSEDSILSKTVTESGSEISHEYENISNDLTSDSGSIQKLMNSLSSLQIPASYSKVSQNSDISKSTENGNLNDSIQKIADLVQKKYETSLKKNTQEVLYRQTSTQQDDTDVKKHPSASDLIKKFNEVASTSKESLKWPKLSQGKSKENESSLKEKVEGENAKQFESVDVAEKDPVNNTSVIGNIEDNKDSVKKIDKGKAVYTKRTMGARLRQKNIKVNLAKGEAQLDQKSTRSIRPLPLVSLKKVLSSTLPPRDALKPRYSPRQKKPSTATPADSKSHDMPELRRTRTTIKPLPASKSRPQTASPTRSKGISPVTQRRLEAAKLRQRMGIPPFKQAENTEKEKIVDLSVIPSENLMPSSEANPDIRFTQPKVGTSNFHAQCIEDSENSVESNLVNWESVLRDDDQESKKTKQTSDTNKSVIRLKIQTIPKQMEKPESPTEIKKKSTSPKKQTSNELEGNELSEKQNEQHLKIIKRLEQENKKLNEELVKLSDENKVIKAESYELSVKHKTLGEKYSLQSKKNNDNTKKLQDTEKILEDVKKLNNKLRSESEAKAELRKKTNLLSESNIRHENEKRQALEALANVKKELELNSMQLKNAEASLSRERENTLQLQKQITFLKEDSEKKARKLEDMSVLLTEKAEKIERLSKSNIIMQEPRQALCETLSKIGSIVGHVLQADALCKLVNDKEMEANELKMLVNAVTKCISDKDVEIQVLRENLTNLQLSNKDNHKLIETLIEYNGNSEKHAHNEAKKMEGIEVQSYYPASNLTNTILSQNNQTSNGQRKIFANYNELFTNLEARRSSYQRLETKIRNLEEQHSHCGMRRTLQESRIAELELQLAGIADYGAI